MSLSLKHIPCPAGDTCTAFQCIFGHERDKKKDEENSIPEEQQPASSVADNGAELDGPPRKRAKIWDQPGQAKVKDTTIHKPSGAAGETIDPRDKALSKGQQTEISRNVKDSEKPSSLPTPHSKTSKPVPTTSAPAALPTNASQTSRSAAGPSVNSKPPAKKESLNPRLLKKSPASHAIRYKLLTLLHDQLKRLNDLAKAKVKKDVSMKSYVLTDQEVITLCLDTEEQMAIHNPSVYANTMKNEIMKMKRMALTDWVKKQEKALNSSVQGANGTSLTEDTKNLKTGLTPAQELAMLKKIQTRIDGLGAFGYVSEIPSTKDVEAARQGKEAGQGYEKCVRCQARFQVFPGRREEDGALTTGGSCTYHPGRQRRLSHQPGDSMEKASMVWRCCGGEIGSEGCQTHAHHVYKVESPNTLSTILEFASTPENPSAPINRAVCLDCEMGYTTNGMEAIRVTATDWQTEKVILDGLVQPYGEILDCNTAFSGVRAEDLVTAKPWTSSGAEQVKSANQGPQAHSAGLKKFPNLHAAREAFFTLISPETFILGHALENDLNTMRIVHPCIIDTILLYPARSGLPFRQALKTLMANVLGRQIQQHVDGVGHDSAEDAIAAGQLIKWSAKNAWGNLKRQGWEWDGDSLIQPHVDNNGSGAASSTKESPRRSALEIKA